MKHVTIYREQGRYAGWPANYGMWSWGSEVVVGFTSGYHLEEGGFHARDKTRSFETLQARSLDGGHTWQVGPIHARTPGNRALSADEHMEPQLQVANELDGFNKPQPHPGDVDFTHPDFALMCARSGLNAGSRSWFYTSTDRCRTWQGPYSMPMFDQPGISARTDYLISGPQELLLFLTAAKSNGREGRVFCARTTDGGRMFRFVSWIGPEPAGYHIMPAALRITDSHILCAIRCSERPLEGNRRDWIDLYESFDNGASWAFKNCPAPRNGDGGSPPTLTRLKDGQLCITYGYRDSPFGIRARLSPDDGVSWEEEITLRDDGGSHDLGYPRTRQLDDGTIVTAYYFNDRLGGPAYIAATLWKV